ncbi:hypothetical protein BX600DRAFT_266958 [Xylariales sp. PMI_506]|nr:hypothetical protein BX600DRAFT_266958 [Xylariales sp. PMI_506]
MEAARNAGVTQAKPAPYGQACINCSQAKCRCVLRVAGGGPCERCHRLGKECIPIERVKRRTRQKASSRDSSNIINNTNSNNNNNNNRNSRSNRSSRIANIEGKLDDLVSLLQVHQEPVQQMPLPVRGSTDTVPVTASGSEGSKGAHNWHTRSATATATADKTQLPPPSTAQPNGYDLLPADAEKCLEEFRAEHLHFFPFLEISSTTTAWQFQQDKPLLWLVIIAVCARSPMPQADIIIKIREMIATQLLIQGQRNLDLLLGILTYMTWSQNLTSGRLQLSLMANMAWSLATDLRINTVMTEEGSHSLGCTTPFPNPKATAYKPRTHEDRRALLGCYITTSSISAMLRYDQVRWSPVMEEAAEALSTSNERLEDHLIVALARVTRVAEKATRTVRRSAQQPQHRADSSIDHIEALQASLAQVKSGIPTDLLQNGVLLSYLYNAQISIYELALLPPPVSASTSARPVRFKKLKYLDSCVEATKLSLENYLYFDVNAYIALPCSVMFHFGRSLQVLYWLSLVDEPGWDHSAVQERADVLDYNARIAERIEQAGVIFNSKGGRANYQVFSSAAAILRKTSGVWSQMLQKVGGSHRVASQSTTAANSSTEVVFDPLFSELLDDNWAIEMLGPYEQ